MQQRISSRYNSYRWGVQLPALCEPQRRAPSAAAVQNISAVGHFRCHRVQREHQQKDSQSNDFLSSAFFGSMIG